MKTLLKPLALAVALALPAASQAALLYDGYVRVTDADTQADLGYVGRSHNVFGEFGVTSVAADRLHVRFTDAPRFSIETLNGPAGSPHHLGGISGAANANDDLGAGSYHYAYLGSTAFTAAGAAAGAGANSFTDATGLPAAIQSSIWDLAGGSVLQAGWVNGDLAVASTFFAYVPGDDLITITGDLAEFRNAFGAAPQIVLTFEGTVTSTTVPEPSSMALAGIALWGAWRAGGRRRRGG